MATTIKLKNGSGAPDAADLVQGEVALDLTNKRIYSENAAGAVIEMGTSPSTIDINAGTIDGTVIGGASAAAGTFTTANATTVDTTNIEVTNVKAKDGTASATIADSTGVMTIASSVLTTTDINGGTIDGTTIGGASAGAGTFTTLGATGDVDIADKIVHTGDTNTAIRFPAADNVSVETAGSERMRINNDGNVGIGTTSIRLGERLHVLGQGIVTSSAENTNMGLFGTFGGNEQLIGSFNNIPVVFRTNNTERARIDSSGNVGIRTDSPEAQLHVYQPSGQTGFYVTRAPTIAGGPAVGITTDSVAGRINAYGTVLKFFTGASGGSLGERMALTSTGDLDLTTGGGDIIMANGAGIDFSASAGGGASSSILDDYEEGTWTPAYVPETGAFGSITYDPFTFGNYIKIGAMVIAVGFIRTDAISIGTASGIAKIDGLPFTLTTGQYRGQVAITRAVEVGGASNTPIIGGNVSDATTEFLLYKDHSGALLLCSDLGTSSNDNQIGFVITYYVG